MSEKNKKNIGLSAIFGAVTGAIAPIAGVVTGIAGYALADKMGGGDYATMGTAAVGFIAGLYAVADGTKAIAKKCTEKFNSLAYDAGVAAGFISLTVCASYVKQNDLLDTLQQPEEPAVIELASPEL